MKTRDFRDNKDWRKSGRCRLNDCVYVSGELDAVRDSKAGSSAPALQLSREALSALVSALPALSTPAASAVVA